MSGREVATRTLNLTSLLAAAWAGASRPYTLTARTTRNARSSIRICRTTFVLVRAEVRPRLQRSKRVVIANYRPRIGVDSDPRPFLILKGGGRFTWESLRLGVLGYGADESD